MQIIDDSKGELCSAMPFTGLLRAHLWEWSGEANFVHYILFDGIEITSFLLLFLHFWRCSIGLHFYLVAWRGRKGLDSEPRVQILYAQVCLVSATWCSEFSYKFSKGLKLCNVWTSILVYDSFAFIVTNHQISNAINRTCIICLHVWNS